MRSAGWSWTRVSPWISTNGLQARLQLVGKAPHAAILVEVTIIVAEGRAIGQLGIGVGGAIDGGAGSDLEAIKGLVEADGRAVGGVNRIFLQAGLHIRAAGIVGGEPQAELRGQLEIAIDVDAAVDMAGKVGAVNLDRRGRGKAVDRRRHVVGVARERAAQIGDQRVALPVGHHEKVGRDDISRRADRLVQTRRIGVVAGGELEPTLDQEAAGIVADRAERILVELEAAAQRLAGHVAGQRRRHRRLVRSLGGWRRDARRAERSIRRCRRHRRAGTDRAFRLWLSGIELWLQPLAVERIVSGGAGAIGSGQAVGRDLIGRVLARARRRLLALAQIGIGIGQRRQRIRGCLRHARGTAGRERVG
ncbi:hypothetical protein ACVWW2_008095 [Bradyrhizobium sp. LM4.3]